MTRTFSAAMLLALCGFAQSTRDDYRTAYKNWRQLDPTLESDSAAGGAAVAGRAERAATESAKYGGARGAFLNTFNDELEQKALWLENAPAAPPAPLESTKNVRDHVTAETAVVERNIETFAADKDPGIQQLRQALERERAALGALSSAIAERQRAAGSAQDAAGAAEQTRLKVLAAYRELTVGLKQTVEETGRETSAWAEYYQKLADSAKGVAVMPAPRAVPPQPVPVKDEAPAPRAVKPAITPLSLLRYTGAWVFPSTNGLYHGPQPEVIDLVVREDNGHASGTLLARFKLPPGSPGDPELRLDFAGDFKNTRNQTFALETSDGAMGSIELIPGPAFNLLEVNLQTEMKPGKVRQANFMLVKK